MNIITQVARKDEDRKEGKKERVEPLKESDSE